jgi:hypothetical protein
MPDIDKFQPEKRALGQLLSSTKRLEITRELLAYADAWSPLLVQSRQERICELAQTIWPTSLGD